MFKFENEQLPEAKEKKIKETIDRLKKRNEKLQKFRENVKMRSAVLGGLGGFAAGGVGMLIAEWKYFGGLGLSLQSMVDVVGVAVNTGAAGALLSIPVAATITAAPTVIQDINNLRIKNLQKKISAPKEVRPTEDIMAEQEAKIKDATHKYSVAVMAKDTKRKIRLTEKRMEKEIHTKEVFLKAMELAKVDGKEKTVQRLMTVASKHDDRIATGAIRTSVRALAGVTANFIANEFVGPKAAPYFKAAAAISFVAAGYEAVKTAALVAPVIKERRDAKRALKILEKYVKQRES